MYMLLKRLVLKVNTHSINYFVDKLKTYDNLIEDKEKRIKELDELINNKEIELSNKEEKEISKDKNVFLYDMGNAKYIDKDIFKKMKEVDEKFKYDNDKIIKDFIKNVFDNEMLVVYAKYIKIEKKFTHDKVFKLLTKRESEQFSEVQKILGDSTEILDDFMMVNKKFNLKKFLSYLNRIISDLDPCIYVYVGNKEENYNHINKYIRTKYDKTIFKGLKIIYKRKLYDYSI